MRTSKRKLLLRPSSSIFTHAVLTCEMLYFKHRVASTSDERLAGRGKIPSSLPPDVLRSALRYMLLAFSEELNQRSGIPNRMWRLSHKDHGRFTATWTSIFGPEICPAIASASWTIRKFCWHLFNQTARHSGERSKIYTCPSIRSTLTKSC